MIPMDEVIAPIVLGIIQGITEWLPISSKSQIMLLGISYFGVTPEKILSLSIFLHIGTLLSSIIYFRQDLLKIIHQIRKPTGEKNSSSTKMTLFSFLLVSTIITGVVGLPLFLLIRGVFTQLSGELAVAIIGIGLIITGILFMISKQKGLRKENKIRLKDAVIAGAFQGFSVLPGVSRSGTTTTSLLYLHFSQDSALKLSFLMSIPAVLAAEIVFYLIEGFTGISMVQAIMLILSSFITGFLSISVLIKISRKINFSYFCIGLGIISVAPLLIGYVL
jgi:undecaprenyl-diphosphatase